MNTNFDSELDLFFRDLFDKTTTFQPLGTVEKFSYPVDIIYNKNGLEIEIPVVGLDKSEITIGVEDDILTVSYDKTKKEKQDKENERQYIHRSIARRSFNFSWKISRKYDFAKLSASMDKGLLNIFIPISEASKPINIEIK